MEDSYAAGPRTRPRGSARCYNPRVRGRRNRSDGPPAGPPRDRWADHARGLGIVLVVYGHVARGLMNAGVLPRGGFWLRLDEAIYAFHMPLFFFLSGLYLVPSLRKRGRLGVALSKVDTILYPYLLWTLLHGSARLLMNGHTNHGTLGVQEVLAFWVPLDQFWFLFGLFFVFLLALAPWPLPRGRRGRRLLVPLLLYGSLLLYATRGQLPLAWQQVYVVPFAVYFALGAAYAGLTARLPAWKTTLGCAGLGAALLVFLVLRHGDELLNPWGAFAPSGRTLLLATAGILLTVATARLTARLRAPGLAALGAASLLIYVSHTVFAAGARIALQRTLGVEDPAVHLALGLAAGLGVPTGLLWLFGDRRLSFLLRTPAPLRVTRMLEPREPAQPEPRPRPAAA